MFTCNWYIASSVNPVFAQIIKDMAAALKSYSRDIDLHIIDARDSSYRAGFERFTNIFAHKNIWHLFGIAPFWWKIVRIHSRTVHTLLDKTCWAGYPTRLFTEGTLNGEGVIYPVFDSLVNQTQSEGTHKAVFIYGTNNNISLPEGDYEIFDISQKVLRPEALSGVYIANDIGPREAMRAGLLTMRGTAVASRKSGWLDEILGPGGYFLLDDNTDLNRIIKFGLGEKGRHMAMAARHFLKSRRSHERCADSIMTLYRKIDAQ